MNDVWQQLDRRWDADTPAALATVVSAYGSAPRQPRAVMICTPQGKVIGSVSGGRVEGAVQALFSYSYGQVACNAE